MSSDITVNVTAESSIDVNITPASNIEIALTGGVGAGGNVFGPASSVADNLTSFYNTGGKIIKDSGISAASVSGHLAGTSNKHTGSVITNTPSGGVAATNVQSAINELDSDKLAKASNLSDLANTTTARSNLGLGNSATLNTGTTAGTVATGDHNHTGVYEPANANIQSHITSTENPHSVTKTQVGLGNVTDNAQVKKISSSVDNTVMRWDGITGDLPQGSLATIDDSGSVNIPSGQSYKINGSAITYADVGAAPTANGVTNGNSHDHAGGDGAQINHTTLSNIGTNTHAQIDSHITSTENPHSTTLAQAATAGASTTVDITVGDIINIGDGTDTDKTIYANNGDANKPAIKYDSTGSKWQYSNDGSSYSDIGSGGAAGVSSLTATAPIAGNVTTGDVTISIPVATSTADGYLSSADWDTFNGKVSGTIGNSSGNIVSRPGDNTVGADTISEISSGVGVTADGVLLKDNDVQADEVRTDIITEKTATNGVAIEGVTAKDSFLEMTEIAAPDSPAENKLRLYAKDSSGDSKLYIKDSAGTETELGAGGGGGTWGSITGTLNDQTDLKNRVIDTSTSTLTADDNGKILYVSSTYPPVTDGGIAKWTLENVLTDSVGDYDLTNSGLTFSTDATFPLGSQYVAVCDGSSKATFTPTSFPATTSARTLCAWVKTSSSSEAYFLTYGAYANNQLNSLGVNSAGKFAVAGHEGGTGLDSTTSISDGDWHHVALTYNGTTAILYVDGVSVASGAKTWATGTTDGCIGAYGYSGYEGYWTGSIVDARAYNRVLTATELLSIINGETGSSVYTISATELSDLALKANVLELDNTTEFTPTADYHPSTKKYVDDNAGGGGLTWTQVSADGTTATNGSGILANTTTAAFTVTLPATPVNGDTVGFIDVSGTCGTNALTIARNGESIQGIAENLLVDYDNAAFSLVYDETFGWRLFDYQIGSVDYDIFALKSNVLELDNTDAFTPTADYHPATKLYSDGFIASPLFINMLTKVPYAIGQGTWDVVFQTTHLYAGSFRNLLAAANGDNFTVNFSVPAGTYRFDMNIIKNTNAAKLDVFVDSTKILNAFDLYSATAIVTDITSITGVALTAGTHALKFAINGKNASSSAYIMNMSAIQISRTGD